jgi:hypothetical protein
MCHVQPWPLFPSTRTGVRALLPHVRADGGRRAAPPEGGASSPWVRRPTTTHPRILSTIMSSERPFVYCRHTHL